MAKAPKLRLSFLNSIQICRPNDPSTLVKTPLPSFTYIRSHSSKTYDISLPTFLDPPSSPIQLSTKCKVNSSIITQQQEPKSCMVHHTKSSLNNEFRTRAYSTTKREEKEKLNHSHFSSTSLNEVAPTQKKERILMKKPKAKVDTNTSVSWAGNDDSLSSPRPSFNSSCSNQLEEPLNRSEKSVRQRRVRTRRFKRYGSKDWKDSSVGKLENEPLEKVDSGRSMHRQVNRSFVVLKRSVDPYQDFKKSMLEMIVERQIFEPKDLEQLLMSFLSLNSRMHHKDIFKAFSEIWKEVFSGSFS